jgi:hypothetical protein
MKKKTHKQSENNMISRQLILIYYVLFIDAYKYCFKEANHYLFLNDMSQIKIPLLPLDCLYCQSAYQVSLSIEKRSLFLENQSTG